MYVNSFFDGLSNGELLKFKTGPPCIRKIQSHSGCSTKNKQVGRNFWYNWRRHNSWIGFSWFFLYRSMSFVRHPV